MRFKTLTLARFGHFTDFKLDFGTASSRQPDLHLLYGPNEAGKSTTLAAMVDLLYGIQRRTPWNFLHANAVLELEACLQQDNQSVDIKRFKNHLANAGNQRLERFPLDLQGLTREDYARRFSFNEQTLQEGGDQILNSDGDVGQAIFSAGAGLANLKKQMDDALSSANAFWQPNKKANLKLTELKSLLAENKKRLDATKLDSREWKKRQLALQQVTLQRDELRQKRDNIQTSINQLEKRKSAQALAVHHRALKNNRDAMPAESIVPFKHVRAADFRDGKAARKMLDTTREQLELCRIARAREADLLSQQEKLKTSIEAITPDSQTQRLLLTAERIQTLSDEAPAVYEWQQQLATHTSTIERCTVELDEARGRLDLSPETSLEDKLPGESLLQEMQKLLDEEQALSSAVAHAQDELSRLEDLPETETSSTVRLEEQRANTDIAEQLLQSLHKDALVSQLARATESLLESRHTLGNQLEKADLTAETLSALNLPDASWLNQQLEEISRWHSQIDQIKKNADSLSQDNRNIQTRCNELKHQGAVESSRLEESLSSRDNAWHVHSQALDELQPHPVLQKSARDYEKSRNNHDTLQAQLISGNQASTELLLLQQQLLTQQDEYRELLDVKLPESQEGSQACVDQLKMAVQDFYKLPEINADLLREKHRSASQLLSEQEDIQTQVVALGVLEQKASEQRRKLLAVLAPLQTDEQHKALSRLDLDDLLAQAGKIIETQKIELAKQQDISKAQAALIKSHASRQAQLDQSQRAKNGWQQHWDKLMEDTLFSGMPLSKARDSLAWMASLPPLIDNLRQASRDSEHIKARLGTREKAISTLLAELGEESLADAVQQLGKATNQAKELAELESSLQQLNEDLEKNTQKYASTLSTIENLRQELNTIDDDALIELLLHTEQHRTINDQCNQTLAQIQEISGSQNTEDEIDQLAQDEGEEALEQQLSELHAQLQDASTIYDESSQAWALANQNLLDIGDENEYPRLSQERQNLLLQTMDQARQCAIARTGQKVLNAAMAKYRQEHQSIILKEAEQAFTTLTSGNYVKLLPRDDGNGKESLFVVDQQQKSRKVTELSTGTRYQLYLALRAAAHADYASQRTPLPFVADDIMESFDDERAGAAFSVLANMAQKGQVIYLTHHQHLIDLASEIVGKDRIRIHHYL